METKNQIQQERRKSTGQGILKQSSNIQVHNADTNHIKFDEDVIAEHDKSRGTRQKIDEPKTPYANDDNENMQDEEDQLTTNASNQDDVQMQDHTEFVIHQNDASLQKAEEEVKRHLEEAERNKQLNAQLQKEQATQLGGQPGSNFNEQLMQKLDNTQQELDEEERKRKDHYKNELKAAQLLRRQSKDEEDEDDQ